MAGNLLNREQPKKKIKNALFQQNQNIEENIDEVKIKEEQIVIKNEEEPILNKDNKEELKNNEVLEIPVEQVQTQTVTIIQKPIQEIQETEVKQFSSLEQEYINKLADIRQKIDNPEPISRMNKRRKYTEDKRRNVTFSIRDDLSYIIDDLVDDAKLFKGLFSDEVLLLGIEKYIEKYGLK